MREGLAIFWDDNVDFTLQTMSTHHMDFVVTLVADPVWRLIGIYSYSEDGGKHKTWQLIE